uniref:Uncharacterized protein n=1 Tax=Meloidogyne enterolobii TaxID=390850 RepID=A0A6V7V6Q6_MELEN|nr:unnamed protein product [Meloidogyne enterolobii]
MNKFILVKSRQKTDLFISLIIPNIRQIKVLTNFFYYSLIIPKWLYFQLKDFGAVIIGVETTYIYFDPLSLENVLLP